ncbi:MAG: hypothetical protein Q9220_007630 [cf. Caloplaca sp. 1 TL-2023]
MDFETLHQASLEYGIYDADQRDINPFWYRESMHTGYEFRPGPREPDKFQPSCRLDLDETGNYDPSAKGLQQFLPIKRVRYPPLPQVDENGEPLPKKTRATTWQNGRFRGCSLIITLSLNTDKARDVLASGKNNWPFDSPDSSIASYESFWTQGCPSPPSSTSENAEPYLFRPRDRNIDDDDQGDIDEEIDISKITLGHPAARGCIPCFKLRLPCPLLQEGATYPCLDCVEDDLDCELILPPLRKRSCQGCRRRRIQCSYLESNSDHTQPCRTCSNIAVKCVAGPATGRTRTGPSLDQVDIGTMKNSPILPIVKTRPFITCTPCRREHRWCSLRTYAQPAPCNRCTSSATPCTFEPLTNKELKRSQNRLVHLSLSSTTAQQNSTITTRLHAKPKPAHPAADITKTITTRLPHPILFNYLPIDGDTTPSCNFCPASTSLFPLLGLGTVKPTVVDTIDGYIEVCNGHTSSGGHLPTRMCVSCTLDRLCVVSCAGRHEMKRLEKMGDPGGFEYEKVIGWLVGDDDNEEGGVGEGGKGVVDWEWKMGAKEMKEEKKDAG